MGDFLRLNLVPASVKVYEGEVIEDQHTDYWGTSRTFVTSDAIHVYIDNPQGGTPVEAFTNRLEDFEGNPKIGWTALTVDGQTVTIRRSEGCACGSRLKGFNPLAGLPYQRR